MKFKKESLTVTKEFLAKPKLERDRLWAEYFRNYKDKVKPRVVTENTYNQPTRISKKQRTINIMLANGWDMEEIKQRLAFDQN